MNQMRLEHVINNMNMLGMSQLIISDPSSIFYLTGKWIHSGERMTVLYLNVTGVKKLIVNELFPLHEILDLKLVYFNDNDNGVEILSSHLDHKGVLGIDKNWPSKFLLPLIQKMPDVSFVNGSDAIDQTRMIKDSEEQAFMRAASLLNDTAMQHLIAAFKPEDTELDMTRKLNDIYIGLGADGFSFTPIVAFGANTALPHHEPGTTRIKPGDSIIFDIGCLKNSYCSDMTRTLFYGFAPAIAEEIYEIVLKANEAAISVVKPGIRFCDVDEAARNVIAAAGYGDRFTHRTGHSIGIEVHDYGDVASKNTAVLQPGMIFSIEPGIYLDDAFGVRIEDLVLVTDSGCEVLNHFSKVMAIIQ